MGRPRNERLANATWNPSANEALPRQDALSLWEGSMGDLERSADYWRAKAEEARVVADSLQSETARGHMLSVAKSYDRLAELAEKRPPHLYVVAKDARSR